MSRFSGWKINDLCGLNVLDEVLPKKTKRPRETTAKMRETNKISNRPDYVGMISSALNILGVEHEREYKFLHDRRFKFDIALPKLKIAVEFEGGIFTNGRHTRGKGYANDAKKYNLATMHGWKLLRFTSADVKKLNWEFEAAEEIRKLIEKKNGRHF